MEPMEEANEVKKNIWAKLLRKKIIFSLLLALVVVGGVGFAAMEKISDNPVFCASCHNMQPYYDTFANSSLLANKHEKGGVNCHSCHTPSISQQVSEGVKYVTGNFESPLKKREFPNEFCTRCHDMKKVKGKTNFAESNPHDSHISNKTACNECHSVHQQSTVVCGKCHSFDWAKKLPPDEWKQKK